MSTFTSYLMLTRDYSRTLNNLGRTGQISTAANYYQANIGKVKSVDDLMKDNRLYNYAMKAAGLEDMAYAKAFIRKVLTSDLTDEKSFANKLTDKRYVEFAKTFNFGADGKVKPFTDVQSDLQEQETVDLYNQSIIDKDRAAHEKAASYSRVIDAATSVSSLLTPANRPYLEMALTAYGLGDNAKYFRSDFLEDILTRGLGDPGNPIYNTTTVPDAATRDKLAAFVGAFNFAPSGTVAAGSAQSLTQKSQTIANYLSLSGEASQSAALSAATDAYRQAIATVTNVSDLTGNKFLLDFVKAAYNLPPETTTQNIADALTSDPGDPASVANQLGLGFRRLAEDFDFDASGNAPVGGPQAAEAMGRTVSRYLGMANTESIPRTSESLTYALTINTAGWIENIEQFLDMLGGVSPDEADPKTISDKVAESLSDFFFKSFGIESGKNYSRSFLRDVFTSDLNDPASFANTRVNADGSPDRRWATMASFFSFDPGTGNVVGSPLQSDAKIAELNERYIGAGFGAAPLWQQATLAFKYETKDARSVDEFLNSKSAFAFALTAFGYPKEQPSKSYFRQILTDPAFAAAQATATSDPRLLQFAQAFNFQADGSIPAAGMQTILQRDEMSERFLGQAVSGSGQYNLRVAEDYRTAITGIRTLKDFLAPAKATVFDFAMNAFGIDMTSTTKEQISDVLTSNLADPSSKANQLGGKFLELAQAFNFGVAGVVPTALNAQDTTQLENTINKYLAKNNTAALGQTTVATNNFRSRMQSLQTTADLDGRAAVDVFLNSPASYDYALAAFGLDPRTENKAAIRQALTADRSRSVAFIEPKYRALAEALNFDPDGSIGTPRLAQTSFDAATLAKKYAASYPADKRPDYAPNRPTAQEDLISAETDYYAVTILQLSTAKELASDKRLVSYISKAFGFEEGKLNSSDLEKILTSDLSDSKSFAASHKDMRYREIAALYNFGTDGKSKRVPEQAVQSSGGVYQTYTNYLQQTLEVQEGQSNQGVRLALYFARKASTITSSYAILGDKALYEVVRTALGIPQEAIRADIDVLARTIEKKLNVADLKDPKKLEKFINRFAAMYDVANGGGVGIPSSNALTLIQGSSDTGFSQDMIQSLQRVRRF